MQFHSKIDTIKKIILLTHLGFIVFLPISGLLIEHSPTVIDHILFGMLLLLTLYIYYGIKGNKALDIYRWWLVFIFEIIIVAVAIYIHGGIDSNIYKLYFIIIAQITIVLSTNSAIFSCVLISILYGFASYFNSHETFYIDHWFVNILFLFGVSIPIIYFVKSAREFRMQNEHKETLIKEINEANKQLTEYAFQIQELVVTDSLTKLYNQTHAHERFMIEVEIAKKNNTQLSIAFIDVDNFKNINDTLGHQFGDDVLRAIGETVLKNVRGTNYVAARYGGEEMIIILPSVDAMRAIDLSEKIRKDVSELSFHTHQGHTVSVTVSIGIANFPNDANDKESLTKLADMAMYHAKRTGKNKVVSSQDINNGIINDNTTM